MSAIAFDWARLTRATPQTAEGAYVPRQKEFRSALDSYMIAYVAEQQKRGAATTPRGAAYATPASTSFGISVKRLKSLVLRG